MAIKAVLFDCFGVLIVSGRQSLLDAHPEHHQELHDLGIRADRGFIDHAGYNEEASRIIGLSVDEIEARHLSRNVRNDPAFAWIKELHTSGHYKTALVSNIARDGIDALIPPSERDELFDTVVLSGQIGVTKPSEAIYDVAVERLGVEPFEAVMIDDLLDNIDGAQYAGLRGIVYGNMRQTREDFDLIVAEEADRA